MRIFNNKKNTGPACRQAGQTIIEAAVALSVIMIILGAVAIAITTSVNNSQYIRSQSLAGKYAQEGMEAIRYIRDNDTTTFNTYSGSYCMGLDNIPSAYGAGGCTVNIPDPSLIREVQFVQSSGSCSGGKQVTVNVYWSSPKCASDTLQTRYCHKSQIVSCLSKESSSGSTL